MNESTARAERFERDAPVPPSFTWTVPQKPVAVRIPLAVIEKLEREAVESYRSLTSRGSEIGGLLFGSVASGNPALVEIESYEAVPCDYATGPLYHLSDAELTRLDRTLEERRAAGLRPVGIFRSQTRKGLSLDPSDLKLLDSRFAGAYDIALVVRPSATKSSTAGIFIREDGKINGEASYLEFPFRASQQDAKDNGNEGSVAGPRTVPAAPAAPLAPKPAVRAQIVPIASRREVMPANSPTISEPVAEPTVAEQPQPPAPKPPAPKPAAEAAAAEKPAPPVQKSAPPVQKAAPPVQKAAAPAEKAAPPVEKPAPVVKKEEPAPATAPKPAAKAETAAKIETPAKAVTPAKADTAVIDAEPAAKGSSKMLWIVLGGVASVVLIGGLLFTSGMLHLRNRNLPVSTVETGLALRIERNAGDVLLTWNRDAEVIKHASRAVLTINDGPQHENVEMDLSQLRTGSIVYSPATSDVVFQMVVTAAGQNQPVSETVRVLRTRPSPMPDQNAAATPAPVQTPTKPVAPATSTATNGTPAAPAPAEAEAEPKEEKVALAQAVKPFRADSLAQRLRPTKPEEMPDAPVATGAVPTVAPVNLGGIGGNTVAPAPAAPKSASAPPVAPPAPDKKAASGGQIQQAELLRRRDPEYPKLARESGASGIVELTATIGADGHVKAVKVVRGHPLLRQAAIDAVKQWIYRPTILNGTPVEGQTQVLLNFKAER